MSAPGSLRSDPDFRESFAELDRIVADLAEGRAAPEGDRTASAAALLLAFSELPADDRIALAMRELGGCADEEIAEAMGLPVEDAAGACARAEAGVRHAYAGRSPVAAWLAGLLCTAAVLLALAIGFLWLRPAWQAGVPDPVPAAPEAPVTVAAPRAASASAPGERAPPLGPAPAPVPVAPIPAGDADERPTPPAPIPVEGEAVAPEPAPEAPLVESPVVSESPEEAAGLLAEELRLYRAAEAALDRDEPDEAVARVDAYLDAFPGGRLVDSAELVRLQALTALERWAEAEAQAARLQDLPSLVARRSEIVEFRARALAALGRCPEALVLSESLPRRVAGELRKTCR